MYLLSFLVLNVGILSLKGNIFVSALSPNELHSHIRRRVTSESRDHRWQLSDVRLQVLFFLVSDLSFRRFDSLFEHLLRAHIVEC